MSKVSVYVSHKRSKQVSPRQWETLEIGMSQESEIDDQTVSAEAVREEMRSQLDVEVLNQITEYFYQFDQDDADTPPPSGQSKVTVTSPPKPSVTPSFEKKEDGATVIVGGKKAETQLVRAPVEKAETQTLEGVVTEDKLSSLRAKLQSEEGE